MTDTVVLDIDGTLVDTNYQHALAWYRAFRRHGITIPLWELHRAIGMGGDQLVGAVAGQEVEERCGDDIRAAEAEEYQPLLAETQPLPGAQDLLAAVRDAGLRLVLASSGKPHEVDAYLDLIDGRRFAEAWTDSDDVEQTKPAPDLVQVALEKLENVDTDRAVVIGDSTWDCEAATRAGLPSVAVLTGGFSEEELREAGAQRVYRRLADLAADLGDLPLGTPK